MNNYGVRRGAWTVEEDRLLKECIEKYGDGKWHQVPIRSGLNRCRKSCRLRWLNYLQPNIKRGAFEDDEVDLILRLHKLLGNRWSLIAGRLPGRTSNDVKNYWNTHLKKKLQYVSNDKNSHKDSDQENIMKQSNKVIFRPEARYLSKTSLASLQKQLSDKLNNSVCNQGNDNKGNKDVMNEIDYFSYLSFEFHEEAESINSWWEGCCFIEENAARPVGDRKLDADRRSPATVTESGEEFWPDLELWELLV